MLADYAYRPSGQTPVVPEQRPNSRAGDITLWLGPTNGAWMSRMAAFC